MPSRFNRRRALAAFGSVSLGAVIAACGGDGDDGTKTVEPRRRAGSDLAERFGSSSSCTLAVAQTEGPYYFDADAIRGDIREDREGSRLRLAVRLRDAESCEPLPNAVVDVWHCDALGVYSGFEEGEGERWLRGTQVTDDEGIVEFVTVYPGWYPGRTPHIHAKVHVDTRSVLTTQFYFDEDVTESVYARPPYSSRSGRDTVNDGDGIFDERLLLDLSRDGEGQLGLISLDVRSA